MSPMAWQMLQMWKVSAHSTFTRSCFFSIPVHNEAPAAEQIQLSRNFSSPETSAFQKQLA